MKKCIKCENKHFAKGFCRPHYYITIKEIVNARRRAKRISDPEKIRAKDRKEYAANRERRVESSSKWARENKTQIQARRKHRRQVDPGFKILSNIHSRISRLMRNKKSQSCIKHLGCTPEQLRAHLESRFKPGMTWENYGLSGWHVDHILPLAAFDLTDLKQFQKANHYTNLQPLWATENRRKHAKIVNR